MIGVINWQGILIQFTYNIEPWISNGILPYINMWVDGWNFFLI